MSQGTTVKGRIGGGARSGAGVARTIAWLFEDFDRHEIWRILAAGAVAELVWETWARLIAPLLVGGPLEPAALVLSLFRLDPSLYWLGEVIHFITGFVFYPLGYALVFRRVLPGNAVAKGAVYGVLLWVFALGICATLAGLPPFLGFIPLAYASLAGHVAFGVCGVLTYEALKRH